MKRSVLLDRARSALDKKTKYESPGKMPPFAAATWPISARNDCSGFVDWCLRFSQDRRVDHPLYTKINGGWFETAAIYADGLAQVGYFSILDAVEPGCMLVYPDYKGADGKTHDGHIGIVLATAGQSIADVVEVIHCSLGAWHSEGDAIQITAATIWQKHEGSIAIWFDDLERD
jgi:hypothetical protein